MGIKWLAAHKGLTLIIYFIYYRNPGYLFQRSPSVYSQKAPEKVRKPGLEASNKSQKFIFPAKPEE